MRVLMVIGGSIAAYKALETIRLLRKAGHAVSAVLTAGGAEFITALSVSSLTGEETYTSLFSLKDEIEMGHIRLSREADVILVAPASADMIAKMAHGRADDLATAVLLAADKPVWIAPAMNARMWAHPATRRNLAQVIADGARLIAPGSGELACGEIGDGRMAEPVDIVAAVTANDGDRPLAGKRAVVTAGPTFEPLDPVRFLGNRSSGQQGYAVAEALVRKGAEVTLVSGPVALAAPAGVKCIPVETARQMQQAVLESLPCDVFVATAAVSDWRPAEEAPAKIKKTMKAPSPVRLEENPDILAGVSAGPHRPALVVGFAAETGQLIEQASAKRRRKGCDWILANDVSGGAVFGENETHLHLIDESGVEDWGVMDKRQAAVRLVSRIAQAFGGGDGRRENAA